MKQLYIFLLLVLSCSTAVAQRVVLDFTQYWDGNDKNNTYTQNGYTIHLGTAAHINREETDNPKSYYAILKTSEKGTPTITLPELGFAVEKIEVVGNKGASKSVKQNIYVSSTAVSTETTGVKNEDGSAKTNVYYIKEGYQDGKRKYIIKAIGSSGDAQITYVKIYGKDQTFTDSDDNSTTLTTAKDQVLNATLTRTFDNDGWYTVCLPFATTASAFGDGAKVLEYDNTSDGTVMNFKSTTTLEAGKPYLVLPSQRMENPTFDDVTITATEPTAVGSDYKFVGTFSPIQLSTTTDLFLGADNTLYRPSATSSAMKGFRAYFQMPANASAKPSILADGVTLSISDIHDITPADGRIYTLQGQFVGTSKSALPAGLYIMNDRKVVIRN